MALPKWTDERTQSLTDFVGSETPISQATVASAAEHLETSTRSVSSKLRKMGFDVELASSVSHRTFSDDQEATLLQFVTETLERTLTQILRLHSKADNSLQNQYRGKSFQWNLLPM